MGGGGGESTGPLASGFNFDEISWPGGGKLPREGNDFKYRPLGIDIQRVYFYWSLLQHKGAVPGVMGDRPADAASEVYIGLYESVWSPEVRSCAKVEVGSPSLIVLTVSVDVKQH